MNVVIVDSGISGVACVQGIHFWKKEDNIFSDNKIEDYVGHGTAIYNIIMKHCEKCNVYVIKIFDSEDDVVDEKLLFYTLRYIYEKVDCQIINLSLGLRICMEEQSMEDICRKLDERGTLIVSALDNEGSISFPAIFDTVVGVLSSKDIYNLNTFQYIDNPEKTDVVGYGRLQRVCWLNHKFKMVAGNSYACAHISGILANYFMNSNADCCRKKDAVRYLKDKAGAIINFKKNDYMYFDFEPIINEYRNVVVFPFNKEIHSIIRFKELLKFNICDVYDTKYSCHVGLMTDDILKTKSLYNYKIKNIDQIDWDSFDTIILGHIEEIINITGKREYFLKFIEKLMERRKNIYALDNIELIFPELKFYDCLFTPYKILKGENYVLDNGILFVNDIPVVGVFGTSSEQGKFTLQLILRKIFQEKGYKVGQLGTEPTSYLFGMDAMLHFGYKNNLKLDEYQIVSLLNQQMHSIRSKSPDIILVGSQGATATSNVFNLKNYKFAQMEFLMGTLPDAVILCINTFDDPLEINRTIRLVEALINTKVIALVIFPKILKEMNENEFKIVDLPQDRYQGIKKEYEQMTSINTYILCCEHDMNVLANRIIDFFTEDFVL